MKSSRRFTLVELLVVITIVAILAGLLLPTIGAAIRRARVAKARTEMTTLITAMKAYDGDYDIMPFGYKDSDDKAVGSSDYDVIICFLSQTGTDPDKGNPRKTRYLNVKKQGEYLDPWGHRYVIVADRDGNESLKKDLVEGLYPPPPDASDNPDRFVPTSVIIWSKGPDGQSDSDPSKKVNRDNVYSVDTTWTAGKGHVTN